MHGVKNLNKHCITFLPLQSFNPLDGARWSALAQDIEDWLVTIVVDSCCKEWTWGCDLFWMAFIAANPTFPNGAWPSWNEQITLEGQFAQSWLDKMAEKAGNAQDSEMEDVDVLRKGIWEQFCQGISRYDSLRAV